MIENMSGNYIINIKNIYIIYKIVTKSNINLEIRDFEKIVK